MSIYEVAITSGIALSNGNQSNPTTSTSTSTTSVTPAQLNYSQFVEYNPNSTFQNVLEEAQQIYQNQITDSTQLQYLSTNTAFVIFAFKTYHSYLLPPYINQYKEWYINESTIKFAKNVKASLLMNTKVLI